MKALVLRAPGAPFTLEIVPDPVAGPGEAVARVLNAARARIAGMAQQHLAAMGARVAQGIGLLDELHDLFRREQGGVDWH